MKKAKKGKKVRGSLKNKLFVHIKNSGGIDMQVKELEAFYDVCNSNQPHLIEKEWNRIWNWFMNEKEKEYTTIPHKEVVQRLISEKNYNVRHLAQSSKTLGIQINVGDICYIDFGQAYLYEAGYQHFGLVVSIVHYKAFVVPMTSNRMTYSKAFHQHGEYLFPIGLVPGLTKESVLFLNDAKFINTARIIDVKAHLDPNSEMFKEVKERLKKSIFD